MLTLERIFKSFGGVVATNDLSLEFPERSLSAIVVAYSGNPWEEGQRPSLR